MTILHEQREMLTINYSTDEQIVQDIEACRPGVVWLQIDSRELSPKFLAREDFYLVLQSKVKLFFVDVIISPDDDSVHDENYIKAKLKNMPNHLIVRCGTLMFEKEEPMTDDEIFQIVYNTIRLDNVELFKMLLDIIPGKLDLLPKVYETLRLRDVPLSKEVEFVIESGLINSQFLTVKCNAENTKQVTLQDVKSRILIVIDDIGELRKYSDKDVDKEFLLMARFVCQNIHVLKRQLKSTYREIPWEEMEFCLVNFIDCQTKHNDEHDIVYRIVMDKDKLLNHLFHFAEVLGQKMPELRDKDVNSNLPKLGDQTNGNFADLTKDFYLTKTVYSLQRIESYVKVASSINLDDKTELGKLAIERALQIIGESLKNTLESPNVSDDVHDALLYSAPDKVQEIVTVLRNSLSHAHTLRKKMEFESCKDLGSFRLIQNDLKMIEQHIGRILYRKMIDAARMFLSEVCNSENLVQVRKLFLRLYKLNFGQVELGDTSREDLTVLKRLIRDLQDEIGDLTDAEKRQFVIMEEILMSEEDGLGNVKANYAYGLLTMRELVERGMIDCDDLQRIQKFCLDHVDSLTNELPPGRLKDIFSLISEVFKNVSQRKEDGEIPKISELVSKIALIVNLTLGKIGGIMGFKESLEEKVDTRNEAREEVDSILDDIARKLMGRDKDEFLKKLNDKKELHVAKERVLRYITQKLSPNKCEGETDDDDFIKASVEKLDLKPDVVEYLIPNWEKNENRVKRRDDPYGELIRDVEKLQSSLSLTKVNDALTKFLGSIKLTKYTSHVANKEQFQLYFENRLQMLAELLPPSEDPFALMQKYKQDGGLRAAVEMLILDLLEMLEIAGFLEDNRLFLDGYSPVLVGKCLRNYLAHGDALIDSLPFDPSIAIISTALRFIQEGKDLIARENTLIGQRIVVDPELGRHLRGRLETVRKQSETFAAVEAGDLLTLVKMCDGKEADVKSRDLHEWTAMHYASRGGDVKVFKYLLDCGLSMECWDSEGKGALHIAAEFGNFDIVKYIVEGGILGVNTNKDHKQRSPLHYAAMNDRKDVVLALLGYKADVNSQGKDGVTALHLCAKSGHKDIVDALLSDEGCQLELVTKDHCTPLHFAAQIGHEDVVEVLLNKGTLVDALANEDWTPLHFAAQNGHSSVCDVLLKGKAHVDARTGRNWTPLHLAAHDGHKGAVESLCRFKADLVIGGENDWTPLHVAARNGHNDVVLHLLTNGAKLDFPDSCDNTPLHLAVGRGHRDVAQTLMERAPDFVKVDLLRRAVENGHAAVVRVLLLDGIDVDTIHEDQETSLHLASKWGHEDVARTLLENGANVNALTDEEETALHLAARKGHVDVVRVLLENKAHVNAQTKDKWTPLLYAASNGHRDIVDVLLKDFKADVKIVDENGWTALHYAAKNDRRIVVDVLLGKIEVDAVGVNGFTPLHCAALSGNREVVQVLLKKGAYINARTVGNHTPLYMAALQGYKDVVKILLQKRAMVDVITENNQTALHSAAFNGYKFIVALLLKYGANLNSVGVNDQTPLHCAAKMGHREVVELLLKQENINVNASDEDHAKPIHLAALDGHKEVVEALFEKTIDVEATNSKGLSVLHYAAAKGHKEIVDFLLTKKDLKADIGLGVMTPLHAAAAYGHPEVAAAFLNRGAAVDVPDATGFTALHMASQYGFEAVVGVLLEAGAKADALVNTWTPLHFAAQGGHTEVVRLLLPKTRNVNLLDKDNMSPLHLAAREGHKDVVDALLNAGANVNGHDDEEEVPDKDKMTPLHLAVSNGHKEVTEMLVERGAQVDPRTLGDETPLHFAAQKGNLDIVEVLLRFGADFQRANKHDTLVHRAVSGNNTDVMRLIFGLLMSVCGNDSKLMSGCINAQDAEGDTPLMWAAEKGNVDAAKVILDLEWVDVGVKNNNGMTALHWASKCGSLQLVLMLLMKGADANQMDNDGNTALDYAVRLEQKGDLKT